MNTEYDKKLIYYILLICYIYIIYCKYNSNILN